MIHGILFALLFVRPIPRVTGGCSYESDNMTAYRGCVNTGHNGEECANWISVCYWGDDQFITEDRAAENGIGNHNYCRNPGRSRWGPWCYHKGYDKRKIYCTVPDRNCDSGCQVSGAPVQSACPNAEEHEKEDEGKGTCSGPNCEFCQENAVVCGIIGFLVTALVLATAVFIRKSLKWRKEANSFKPNPNGAMIAQVTGSEAHFTGTASRMDADHARAPPIEDRLSRMGTQPRNQPLSCATSVSDNDTIQFRYTYRREQDQPVAVAVPTVEFKRVNNLTSNRFDGSEEFSCHFDNDNVFSDEEQNFADNYESREIKAGPTQVFGDAVRTGEGTLFDRYYEQDVDKWDTGEEFQI